MGLLSSAAGQIEKISGKPKELKYKHFAGFVVGSVNRQLEAGPADTLVVPLKRMTHPTKTRAFIKEVGRLADIQLGGTGLNFDMAGSVQESQSLEVVGVNFVPVPVWKPDLVCFVFRRQPVAEVIELPFPQAGAIGLHKAA